MTVYDNDENVVPKPNYPDAHYNVTEVNGEWVAEHVSNGTKFRWIPETGKWRWIDPDAKLPDWVHLPKTKHGKIAAFVFLGFLVVAFLIWLAG